MPRLPALERRRRTPALVRVEAHGELLVALRDRCDAHVPRCEAQYLVCRDVRHRRREPLLAELAFACLTQLRLTAQHAAIYKSLRTVPICRSLPEVCQVGPLGESQGQTYQRLHNPPASENHIGALSQSVLPHDAPGGFTAEAASENNESHPLMGKRVRLDGLIRQNPVLGLQVPTFMFHFSHSLFTHDSLS